MICCENVVKMLWIWHFFSTIFSQQMLSDRLLLVIIDRQKSNFSNKFKLKLIITYHLRFVVKCFLKKRFVVKVLWKYCKYITFQKIMCHKKL